MRSTKKEPPLRMQTLKPTVSGDEYLLRPAPLIEESVGMESAASPNANQRVQGVTVFEKLMTVTQEIHDP